MNSELVIDTTWLEVCQGPDGKILSRYPKSVFPLMRLWGLPESFDGSLDEFIQANQLLGFHVTVIDMAKKNNEK